jgi:hypothetical protein
VIGDVLAPAKRRSRLDRQARRHLGRQDFVDSLVLPVEHPTKAC